MNTHLNHTLIATIATLMLSTAFHAVAQDSNHSTNDYRWKIELGASMDFLQDKMPQFHGWGEWAIFGYDGIAAHGTKEKRSIGHFAG